MSDKQKSDNGKDKLLSAAQALKRDFFSLAAGKLTIIVLFSITSMVFYLYFNMHTKNIAALLFPSALGDLGAYILRFVSSFTLLGLIPFVATKLLGYSNHDIGLVFDAAFLKSKIFWITTLAFLLTNLVNIFNNELVAYYPFSKTLISLVIQEPWLIGLHALAYFLLYYLPWELLFRGILVFPFLKLLDSDGKVPIYKQASFYLVASLQTIPTVLMHLPHPMIETLATIPFGFLAAWLVLRFRSIAPVLIIHASVGISLDIGIIVKHALQL